MKSVVDEGYLRVQREYLEAGRVAEWMAHPLYLEAEREFRAWQEYSRPDHGGISIMGGGR